MCDGKSLLSTQLKRNNSGMFKIVVMNSYYRKMLLEIISEIGKTVCVQRDAKVSLLFFQYYSVRVETVEFPFEFELNFFKN